MRPFESYIDEIVAPISCSYQEKMELKEELTDHLGLIEREYLIKGYGVEEARVLTLERFGQVNRLQSQLQKVMSKTNNQRKYFFIVWMCTYLLFILMLTFFQPLRSFVYQQIREYYPLTYYSEGCFHEKNTGEMLNAFLQSPYLRYNYIPLQTLSNWLSNYRLVSLRIFVENILASIIVFIPVGFLLPFVLNREKSFWKNVQISMTIGLLVELFQLNLSIGVADVDDVILYTIGSVIGFLLFKLLQACKLAFLKISKSERGDWGWSWD